MPVISIVAPMNVLVFALVFIWGGFCWSAGCWLFRKIVKD